MFESLNLSIRKVYMYNKKKKLHYSGTYQETIFF